MATLRVEIWQEKTLDQKKLLADLLPNAVAKALGDPPESVTVQISEYREIESVGKAGMLKAVEGGR